MNTICSYVLKIMCVNVSGGTFLPCKVPFLQKMYLKLPTLSALKTLCNKAQEVVITTLAFKPTAI